MSDVTCDTSLEMVDLGWLLLDGDPDGPECSVSDLCRCSLNCPDGSPDLDCRDCDTDDVTCLSCSCLGGDWWE